jgi:hypothetical protein
MKMFFFDFFAKKESKTNHFHQNLFPKSLRLKNAFILRGIKKAECHSTFGFFIAATKVADYVY